MASSTGQKTLIFPNLGRILGFMAASLDTSISSSTSVFLKNDQERSIRLKELCILFEKTPSNLLFSSSQIYPALGYVIQVLLNISTQRSTSGVTLYPDKPALREEAASILVHFLSRFTHLASMDELTNQIVPGGTSIILAFLTSWEKESKGVTAHLIKCLGLLLQRGYKKALQEGKLLLILEKCLKICSSMATINADIGGDRYVILQMMHTLINELFDVLNGCKQTEQHEGILKNAKEMLYKCCAILNSSILIQPLKKLLFSPMLEGMDSLLRDLLEDKIPIALGMDPLILYTDISVPITGIINSSSLTALEGHLKLALGCLRCISDRSFQYTQQIASLALLMLCCATKKPITQTTTTVFSINHSLIEFHGTQSFLFDKLSSIDLKTCLQLLRQCIEILSDNDIATFTPLYSLLTMKKTKSFQTIEQLYCLSWIKNLSLNKDIILDVLICSFDEFVTRDLPTTTIDDYNKVELCQIETEDEAWFMAWCHLAAALFNDIRQNNIPYSYDDDNMLAYLQLPLLSLQWEASFSVKDAAILLQKHLFESSPLEYHQLLLNRIINMLRYPVLYPRAPLMLASLLRETSSQGNNTSQLSPILIQLIEVASSSQSMAQFQPAYLFILLSAIRDVLQAASSTFTILPPSRENFVREQQDNDDFERDKCVREMVPSEDAPNATIPRLTLEEEFAHNSIKLAINFITEEQERLAMMALEVISAGINVFSHSSSLVSFERGDDAFLPMAHQLWQPLLQRIILDPRRAISFKAFTIITEQCTGIRGVGTFLCDRLQKELFPRIDILFNHFDVNVTEVVETFIQLITAIFTDRLNEHQPISSSRGKIIRQSVHLIIELVLEGSLEEAMGKRLLVSLANIDADWVWYTLIVECHPNINKIRGKDEHRASIDLYPFKKVGFRSTPFKVEIFIDMVMNELGFVLK